MLDQLAEARIRAKEVLANVGAIFDRVALELAIDGVVHLVEQDAVNVAGEKLVPLSAPDDLDDVPSGTAEDTFEFLDDLAVAANWAIETLEVAVDYPDEIAETCLLYTSPSPRDATLSRMPSSA